MELITGGVLISFLGFLLWVSVKSSGQITSVNHYLSFGDNHHQHTLRRTFEGTNISYGMIFIAFMSYPASYGWAAISIPLGFLAGIIIFVTIFVPRMMASLADNVRFPELLQQRTGSVNIRKMVSILAIISLWLFTFAEVQAVGMLLSDIMHLSAWQSMVTIGLIVLCLMFYVAQGGYRTMLETDNVQMYITYIGSICLLAMIMMKINDTGLTTVMDTVSGHRGLLTNGFDMSVFFAEAFSGFLLAQIYYYDNWQRLTAYVKSELALNQDIGVPVAQQLQAFQHKIRVSYLRGTLYVGFVMTLPLIIGFMMVADASTASPIAYLVEMLQQAWQSYGLFGPMMVLMVLLMLISALMSTADTYTVGAANIVYEDVLGKQTSSNSAQDLKYIKLAVILFLTGVLLMLPLQLDFGLLLLYLIYSANGMVGPVLFSLFRKHVHAKAVALSLAFGLTYPIATMFFPENVFAQVPGIITLTFSIAIVGLWRVKEQ